MINDDETWIVNIKDFISEGSVFLDLAKNQKVLKISILTENHPIVSYKKIILNDIPEDIIGLALKIED